MSQWVEWKGGECPVEKGAIVDYKLRDGYESSVTANSLFWEHRHIGNDIVAYRISDKIQPKVDDRRERFAMKVFCAMLSNTRVDSEKPLHEIAVRYTDNLIAVLDKNGGEG